MDNYQYLRLEQADGIATVTLSRPKALNALSTGVVRELLDAVERVGAMNDVRAVIFTGDGDKAFAAGADIKEMYASDPEAAVEYARLGTETFNKIEHLPQPTIAAVNGYALGGGNELAMACDIRVAADNAVFGQPETGLGIIPGFGGTQRLPRLVGRGMAKWIIYSATNMKADEALRIGLVQKVVPHGELMQTAREMAGKIASRSPYAVRQAKLAVNFGLEMDLASATVFENQTFGHCFTNEDQTEGMRAFIEKGKPAFTGRPLPKAAPAK